MLSTETLGMRIRRLRKAKGLTQRDLATAEIDGSYVSLIEAGKRTPTNRTLEGLATRLGVSVDYLLTGIEDERRRQDEIDLGTAELLLAEGRASEAIHLFRRLVTAPDPKNANRARWGLAAALEASGDLEAAIAGYESMRKEIEEDDADWSLLTVTTALSRCYREAGDLTHAIEVGEHAIVRFRRYGLIGSDAYISVLLTLAMAYSERGDMAKTRHILSEVGQHVEGLGTPRARGAAYWNAAVLAGELGDTAESVRLIERALALFAEGDDERNLARLRNAYATLLMRHDAGRAQESVSMLMEARDRLTTIGSEVDIAYCETELARALTLIGAIDEAVDTARSALSRLDQGMRLEFARARAALAYALVANAEVDEARTEYLAAASALEAMGARRQAALVWLELAAMERSSGDIEQAFTAMSRSLSAGHLRRPFPSPEELSASSSGRRRR